MKRYIWTEDGMEEDPHGPYVEFDDAQQGYVNQPENSVMPFGFSYGIPQEIINAEAKVSRWFAEHNVRDWRLGGSQARRNISGGES